MHCYGSLLAGPLTVINIAKQLQVYLSEGSELFLQQKYKHEINVFEYFKTSKMLPNSKHLHS